MRLTLNHCCIADVEMQEPKPTDNQRKGRRVFINMRISLKCSTM